MRIRNTCWLFLILFSCNNSPKKDSGNKLILATTGMIGDAAKNITRGVADVEVLMGPGVDPHLYKASQGDMEKFQRADIIIYNGLHLEGKLTGIIEKIAKRKPVISVGDGIPKNKLQQSQASGTIYDPHIWLDAGLWAEGIKELSIRLKNLFPNDSAIIGKNANKYLDTLKALNAYALNMMNKIPSKSRVLITSHDAFRYFGRAYHTEVRGLQGISTLSEYGLRDINNMVDFINENKIKAVFIESSVSKRSLMAVIEGCQSVGHPLTEGGVLFSDAMGKENTPEGTYAGMFRHNINTIFKALK